MLVVQGLDPLSDTLLSCESLTVGWLRGIGMTHDKGRETLSLNVLGVFGVMRFAVPLQHFVSHQNIQVPTMGS